MVTRGDIIEDVNPTTEKGAKVVTVAVVPRNILIETLADIDQEITLEDKAGIFANNDTIRTLEKIYAKAKARLEEFEGKKEKSE